MEWIRSSFPPKLGPFGAKVGPGVSLHSIIYQHSWNSLVITPTTTVDVHFLCLYAEVDGIYFRLNSRQQRCQDIALDTCKRGASPWTIKGKAPNVGKGWTPRGSTLLDQLVSSPLNFEPTDSRAIEQEHHPHTGRRAHSA